MSISREQPRKTRRMAWLILSCLCLAMLFVFFTSQGRLVLGPRQKVQVKGGQDRWIGNGIVTSRNRLKPEYRRYRDSESTELKISDNFSEVLIDAVHGDQLAFGLMSNTLPGVDMIDQANLLLKKSGSEWVTLTRFPQPHTPMGFFAGGDRVLATGDTQNAFLAYSTATGKVLEKIKLKGTHMTVPGTWPFVYQHHHNVVDKIDVLQSRVVASWTYRHRLVSDLQTENINFHKDAVLHTNIEEPRYTILESFLIRLGLRDPIQDKEPAIRLIDSKGNSHLLATFPLTKQQHHLEARWIDEGPSVAVRYKDDWFVFEVPAGIWQTLPNR